MKRLIRKAEESVREQFKSRKFTIGDTGGNCQAYAYTKSDNGYYLVTLPGDAGLPEKSEDQVELGKFDEEGEYDFNSGKIFESVPDFFEYWDSLQDK